MSEVTLKVGVPVRSWEIEALNEMHREINDKQAMLEQENVSLRAENAELQAKLERMEKERNLIARFIFTDPPFDVCAGVDIHEMAARYNRGNDRFEAEPEHYYKAFLDCCRAALKEVSDE